MATLSAVRLQQKIPDLFRKQGSKKQDCVVTFTNAVLLSAATSLTVVLITEFRF